MTDSELGRWVENDGAWDVLRAQRDEVSSLKAQLAQAREECAQLCETHDSSLARPGVNLYDSDRRILKQRGHELAAAIRALAPGRTDRALRNDDGALNEALVNPGPYCLHRRNIWTCARRPLHAGEHVGFGPSGSTPVMRWPDGGRHEPKEGET